jgi:hypothetical protein
MELFFVPSITAYTLLLSDSNVMSINTPGNTKIDFATKNNFGCKHFIFKQKKGERFAANA